MTAREVLAEIERRTEKALRPGTSVYRALDKTVIDNRALVAALRAVLDQAEYVLELAEEQGDDDFEGWAPEALAKDVQQTITDALNGVTVGTDR